MVVVDVIGTFCVNRFSQGHNLKATGVHKIYQLPCPLHLIIWTPDWQEDLNKKLSVSFQMNKNAFDLLDENIQLITS